MFRRFNLGFNYPSYCRFNYPITTKFKFVNKINYLKQYETRDFDFEVQQNTEFTNYYLTEEFKNYKPNFIN